MFDHWRLSLFVMSFSCVVILALKIYWCVQIVLGWLSLAPPAEVWHRVVVQPPEIKPEPPFIDELQHGLIMYGLIAFQFLVIVFLVLRPNKIERICEHGFRVEGVRAGSQLVATPSPDFIAEVWIRHSRFTPAKREGTAVRIDGYIYTAAHVIKGAVGIWLKYKGKYMELPVGAEAFVDDDIVRYNYELVSALQMGSGRLNKRFAPQLVNIHNGDVTAMGKLVRNDVVGMVEFDGSTVPSFSGAPYYLGRVIFGIHVGAGVMNVGIDSSLIHTLINTIRPESDTFTSDTSKLYEEFQKTGGKPKFRRAANDFYIVEVGGKYVTYSEEEFESAQEMYDIRQEYETRYPKYRGEAVSYEELLKIHRAGGPAAEPAVVPKKSKVLETLPAVVPEAAKFSFQDSENQEWPAVPVTQPAGPAGEPDLAPRPVTESRPMPRATSPSPSPQQPQKLTSGQKKENVRQSVLSHITSESMKEFAALLDRFDRAGLKINRRSMEALTTLYLGLSPQPSGMEF